MPIVYGIKELYINLQADKIKLVSAVEKPNSIYIREWQKMVKIFNLSIATVQDTCLMLENRNISEVLWIDDDFLVVIFD